MVKIVGDSLQFALTHLKDGFINSCSSFLVILTSRGRYYYWHTESDAVSWLSPRHPRAVISDSAAHIREEMQMAEVDDEEEDEDEEDEKESDMDDDGEVCSL